MRQDYREMNLARRVKCEELHIAYLQALVKDPHQNDREIKRRKNCITEMMADIEKHLAAIKRLEEMSQTAAQKLQEAKTRLLSIKRERNKHLIQKLMEEYINIHKSLEDA